MAHAETVNWPGASGKKYKYWIYSIDTRFKDEPGNYIFTKLNSAGKWTPVYIGETQSLRDRLPNHEKLPCVNQNGGTHLHAHLTSGGQQARLAEETDLVQKFNPPCNK